MGCRETGIDSGAGRPKVDNQHKTTFVWRVTLGRAPTNFRPDHPSSGPSIGH